MTEAFNCCDIMTNFLRTASLNARQTNLCHSAPRILIRNSDRFLYILLEFRNILIRFTQQLLVRVKLPLLVCEVCYLVLLLPHHLLGVRQGVHLVHQRQAKSQLSQECPKTNLRGSGWSPTPFLIFVFFS